MDTSWEERARRAGRGSPKSLEVIDRLREMCLSLPGVSERLSHGEPTWFVRNRVFATVADHHHDDRLAVWCAAPEGAQRMLVQADGERFFIPPYVGGRGWVGVWLDRNVDWRELHGILERAHSLSAGRSESTAKTRTRRS